MSFLVFSAGCGEAAWVLPDGADVSAEIEAYNTVEAWTARGSDGTARRVEALESDPDVGPRPVSEADARAMLRGEIDGLTGFPSE